MAEELNIGTFEQIAELASQLTTNYSSLAGVFYDVFYNPTPKDVTFQMFDSDGKLHDYTVENLAKSNLYRKAGNGSPEGRVAGVTGTMYQDLTNGEAFIKKSADGNQGWFQLVTKALLDGYIMQGNVDPNGELVEGEYVGTVNAPAGTLYINTATTTLYIRLVTPSSGKYWSAISANVGGFAETDLSNITEAGKNVIKSEAVSAIGDKTYTISSSSTDSQYPTAKAVYTTVNALGTSMGETDTRVNNLSTVVGNLDSNKQDKSNLVTSISASSTDTQYPSAKCVYDSLLTKPNDESVVHKQGDEYIYGNKTFSGADLKITDGSLILDNYVTPLDIKPEIVFKDGSSDITIVQGGIYDILDDTYIPQLEISAKRAGVSTNLMIPNIDGQWISKEQDLGLSTAIGTYTFNLRNESSTGVTPIDYLPLHTNDYSYEVLVSMFLAQTSSSVTSTLTINSDIISGTGNGMGCNSNSRFQSLEFAIPMKDTITIRNTGNGSASAVSVILLGYRRLGINS